MLPRTHGCLVCGRDNPHGLHLRLQVDDASGLITTNVTPTANHIGFADVVHGGLIATIADEVMVWAATWAGRRFCYCGELSVRFRRPARPGVPLRFEGKVETRRNRLIASSFRCVDEAGDELSNGYAKYVPLSVEDHMRMVETFVDDAESKAAVAMLTAFN